MASNSAHNEQRPQRLPLSGRNPRRLSFERRLRLWLFLLAIPSAVLSTLLTYQYTSSWLTAALCAAVTSAILALVASVLFERVTRPLQTLSNVVAALRDDDFSFRARGARRGDSLGDLALEINTLASSLQHQRSATLDALTLVELVLTSMQSPVLAFDAASRLRLLNPAAERAFSLQRRSAIGRSATDLGLSPLLATPDHDLYVAEQAKGTNRWSVYRTTFRLYGVPHTLFLLADVAAALREEERLAWQRLIRVLGHEINNSLTPIKSIAGSLRSRLQLSLDMHLGPEFERGLTVIEDRADSLNRFLQAYQRLSRLPAPLLVPTQLAPLLHRVVHLETRLQVKVADGPEVLLLADSDQLQQLLINLIRNGADAALAAAQQEPAVVISWIILAGHVNLRIEDNGAGLMNPTNLFVPFYTTKPGGTGIGLVLAQQIATAHHGTITLRNRQGQAGCEAEVHLPLT